MSLRQLLTRMISFDKEASETLIKREYPMSISDRYRQLVNDVQSYCDEMKSAADSEEEAELRMIGKAVLELKELQDSVGEIPRIRLETELTPVLLKAHSHLDRARLLLDEQGNEDRAAAVWELEQKIYRLLNDL